jgi:hypothetical protein
LAGHFEIIIQKEIAIFPMNDSRNRTASKCRVFLKTCWSIQPSDLIARERNGLRSPMNLLSVEKPSQLTESSLKSVAGRFSTGAPRRPLAYAKIGPKKCKKSKACGSYSTDLHCFFLAV